MTYKDEVVDELLKFRGYTDPSRMAIVNAKLTVDSHLALVRKLERRGVSPFHACMEVEREKWKKEGL